MKTYTNPVTPTTRHGASSLGFSPSRATSQREAFMMLKIEGLAIDEASMRTSISVATLKVRAHRAHKFLKEHPRG